MRHVADVVSVMYLGVMVETGPTQPLWALPLHPYTEALIGAVPHADGTGVLPEALPGEVPDPARPPAAAASTRAARTRSTAVRARSRAAARRAAASAACWLQRPAASPARRASRATRRPAEPLHQLAIATEEE